MDIKKALDTTSGAALIPEKLDPILVELADKATPIRKLLRRIPWSTAVYNYNRRTSHVSAEAYSEADAFSASNATYERATASIKLLRAEGAVSKFLQAVSSDILNAKQAEIESATRSLAQKEEELLITGDSSADAKQPDGLNVQITTTTVDAEAKVASLDTIDDALKAVQEKNGKPNLIILSTRDWWNLNKALRAKYNYVIESPMIEAAPGVKLQSYLGIPVLPSAFIPTNLEAVVDGVTYSDLSYGFVLDTNQIVVPVVQEPKYEEVPSTTQADAFRIWEALALAVKAPDMQCKIVNIGTKTS